MGGTEKLVFAGVAAAAIAAIAFWAGTKQGTDAARADKRAESSATTTSASGQPAQAAQASESPKSAPSQGPSPLGGIDQLDLGHRLANEKANSGKSNPSAASVWKAIEEKLKLPMVEHLQVVGATVGARFCERAMTTSHVYVVVCEFEDEASATKGVEAGSVRTIKRREVLRVRDATCSIQRAAEDKVADADAKRIHDLFLRL